jgi:hypothetical protein
LQLPAVCGADLHESPRLDSALARTVAFALPVAQQEGFGVSPKSLFSSTDFTWQHCFVESSEPVLDDEASSVDAPVKAVPAIATAANRLAIKTIFFMILSLLVRFRHAAC